MTTRTVDVRVDKMIVGGAAEIYQGGPVQFWVRVLNLPYPDINNAVWPADNVFVQDILPAGIIVNGWNAAYFGGASGPASGSGNLLTTIPDLPVNGWVEYTIDATVAVNAPLVFETNTAVVSLPANLCPANAETLVARASFKINRKRSDIVVTKTGVGSFEKGLSSQFVVQITNNGPNDVWGGSFSDMLPDGVFVKDWSAVFAGGAGGTDKGKVLPVTLDLPVGGSATYTLNVWIDPDACVGSVVNTAKYAFPADTVALNGAGCTTVDYGFQIIESQNFYCQSVCGCLMDVCCDSSSVPVGYVVVKLVTPDGVPAYDSFTNRQYLNGFSYRFELDSNGCFETCPLPVNSQLLSKRTGEPIPTFYELTVFAGVQSVNVLNPAITKQASYRFRFSADDVVNGCRNVYEIDEISGRSKPCFALGGGCGSCVNCRSL